MLEEGSNSAKLQAIEQKYHHQVIRLAHDIPLAGHLGQEEIAQRILRWRKGRHNVKADALSQLLLMPQFMPEKEGGCNGLA